MNKKYNNITLCLILGLSMLSLAANANTLNKLDIQRSNTSNSGLNVTIYTDNPYDENVAVSKKSDNKYVILMPNVSGSSSSNVDISSIKDIVSDVSVKSVEDGSSGYTKVTVTTTKPVSISTSTKKSTPLTEEQKAYKNLIAQTRGYTPSSSNNTYKAPVQTVNVPQPKAKPEPMVFTAENVTKPTAKPVESKKKVQEDIRPKSIIEQVREVIATAPAVSVAKTNKGNASSAEKVNAKESLNNQVKKDTKLTEKISNQKDNTLANLRQDIINENKNLKNQTANNADSNIQTSQQTSTNTAQTNNFQRNKGNNNNMLTLLIILAAAFAGLVVFFKSVKNSIEKSITLKKSFKENLSHQPAKPIVEDYSNITEDKSLNWQEKYQKFLSCTEEINPSDGILRHVGNGEYEFVKAEDSGIIGDVEYTDGNAILKPKKDLKFKSYNKPALNSSPEKVQPIKKVKNQSLTPDKAPRLKVVADTQSSGYNTSSGYKQSLKSVKSSLERTLQSSPSVERTNLKKDISAKQALDTVYSEGNSIADDMRKSRKLTTFANKIALEQTRRNTPFPKRSSDIIRSSRNIESKHVNLENSNLYSPARKFSDGNLSSADLIAKGGFSLNRASVSNVTSPIKNSTGYSMSTIDEFFDITDSSSKITAPASLSNKVADRLAKISSGYASPLDRHEKANILANKNVKAGYNIDSESGFYIISDKNGKASLIGRVGDSITTLKEFNDSENIKLQVRKDNENVYMVRVGSDRYLVEISGDKMGVLIEL